MRAFLASLLTLRALLVVLGLAGIAAAIWILGPFVSFGWAGLSDTPPLADRQARLVTIAALFGLAFLFALVRFLMARAANRRMIASLLDQDQLGLVADGRENDEVALLRERFEKALTVLRDRFFPGTKGDGFLFELPWYVIVGPPGAGKTTILRHSGLEFPLREEGGAEAIAGIGGTRHCDWWFTDKAVLIDTAGRYTTQDSNAEVDRAAWLGFLNLLKRFRRRRPLNGLIMALSIGDVLTASEADRKRMVDALRRRIQEILKTLAVDLPIYVLFTKADLIAGFTEYFDALDEEERAQVWGMTFPLDTAGTRLTELFDLNYHDLVHRLEQALPERMQGERNLRRRAAMFTFPKEFAGARALLGAFVYDVFRPTRVDQPAMLRGVYFTSGTQEGAPIDRLVGQLGRSFGLAPAARTPFRGAGKAFFIRRLLSDVIFEEEGLAGLDRKLERRLAVLQTAAYVAAFGAVAVTGLLWFGAFSRSEARITASDQAARVLEQRLGDIRGAPTFATVLPALEAARALVDATGERSVLAWLDGLGISATPRLGPLARDTYDRVLLDRLVPAFVNRIADQLQATTLQGDLEQTREALRIYLMLGDPSRFERSSIQRAARNELPLAFPVDPQRRTAMAGHLDRMSELLPVPLTLNPNLIAAARQRLTREPRTEQLYARLLREAAQSPRLRPLDFSLVVGNTSIEINAARTGTPATPRVLIPGVFTREGFFDFVLPRVPLLVREDQGTDWVLAGTPVQDSMTQRVTREVLDRYVADYIRQWTLAVGAVQLVAFDDLPRGMVVLQGLAGPQSPLDRVLDVVRQNTDLPPPAEGEGGLLAQATAAVQGGATAAAAAQQGAAAAIRAALGDVPWPGTRISEAFRPLTSLTVSGAGGQAPIARVRELLSNLFSAMGGVANAPDPRIAAAQIVQRRVRDASADVFANLRADSALRPEPVRSILREIGTQSWAILLRQALDGVNDIWRREVLPACEGMIFNRYPLFPNATEDMALRDFGDFFRQGGVIDDFFTKHLQPLVVDQRTGFAAARIDGVALPFRTDSLAAFSRARTIRRAFFAGQGAAPQVKFSLRPIFLHPQVLRATLSLDGREILYRHEPPRPVEVEWPTRSDSSVISVALTLVNGRETRVERSGPWALFRLIDAARATTRGAADRFQFSVGEANGPRITYELRASSTQNPFSLDDLRQFRCPDAL